MSSSLQVLEVASKNMGKAVVLLEEVKLLFNQSRIVADESCFPVLSGLQDKVRHVSSSLLEASGSVEQAICIIKQHFNSPTDTLMYADYELPSRDDRKPELTTDEKPEAGEEKTEAFDCLEMKLEDEEDRVEIFSHQNPGSPERLEDFYTSHSHDEGIDDSTTKDESIDKEFKSKRRKEKGDLEDNHCPQCQAKFKTRANLKVHQANVHNAVKVACQLCGFVSSNLKALKRHKKMNHEVTKSFKCVLCDATFKGSSYLKIHIDNVHNSSKVACELCGFLSSNSSALAKHIKFKHHTKDRISLQCDQCEFSHWNKYTLQTHIQSKHGDTKFRCDVCNFESTCKQTLGNHKRKMHSEKKFHCDRCNYSCMFQSILKTHISSVHEGVRFSCDECEYSSAHKGDLKVHKRVVHQGFRVKCEECDFTTTKKYKLKIHIRNKHATKDAI